jgi:hypothetical protein
LKRGVFFPFLREKKKRRRKEYLASDVKILQVKNKPPKISS